MVDAPNNTPPLDRPPEAISTPLGNAITRGQAGRYCRAKYGFGSASMLAKLAMNGSGPPFFKPSATRSLYPVASLDAWALAKLGEARTSFSTAAE